MKSLVIGTGILAAIAWLVPGLVVIGLFLLVVPGLVLMAMPTVFGYLLLTWLIRLALPLNDDRAAYPLAAAAAVALAALVMLPFRFAAERAFAEAAVPEIVPPAPIALAGHVRYETDSPLQSPEPPACDALCLAMLDLPSVTSVTLVRYGQTVTYGLIAADDTAPEGLVPYAPEQILLLTDRTFDGSAMLETGAALKAHWRERLSGPQRLVIAAGPAGAPDWLLRARADGVTQIIGPDGAARLRAVQLRHRIPAIPPFFAFKAASAASGFAQDGFVIGGSERKTSSAFDQMQPDPLIGRHLALKDYAALFGPGAR